MSSYVLLEDAKNFEVYSISHMFYRVMMAVSNPRGHGLLLNPQEAMMVWIIQEQRGSDGLEPLRRYVESTFSDQKTNEIDSIEKLLTVIRGFYHHGKYNITKVTAILSYSACFTQCIFGGDPQYTMRVASKLAEFILYEWPGQIESISRELYNFDLVLWVYFHIKQRILLWKHLWNYHLRNRNQNLNTD
ncbi:F12 [Felid gammaherpesvirus 1]|uniref:F12 n=1 Tax=Felid gammaherpesvirus 1 TaxID=2560468 RepID=A0A0M4M4G1_9GAMA|nr:F12 [Felis catus gammaherpesvirus 1]ALE14718.1 F12 [Felis catus gammaherpesvirus 1]